MKVWGIDRAVWAHALPFVAWIGLMKLPGLQPAIRYAVQTAAVFGLLAWLRPWRYYEGSFRIRNLPLSAVVGLAVYALWVLPEMSGFAPFPALRDFYLRYGVRPWGVLPAPLTESPFAPERCGWLLACARLAGSAFVIAVAEEFFWRGFLCRWLQSKAFLAVNPAAIRWPILLAVAAAFGLEHDRWFAGMAAGLAYGWLYWRTRDIGAAVAAHVVTNFTLGCYVLASGAYRFW